MNVADLVLRLARRRVACLVVMALALLAAAAAWSTAGSSRQSVAAVVIVPPPTGDSTPADANPLLFLDNNLAQLATVLASTLQSAQVVAALDAAGATSAYSISTVTGTDPSFAQLSPELQFTTTGRSAATTQLTARTLITQAAAQLTTLQDHAKVPAASRAALVTVTAPAPGVVVGNGRVRAAGSIGVGVLVIGLLAVLLADVLVQRRRTTPAGTLAARTPAAPSSDARPAAPPSDARPAALPSDVGRPVAGQHRLAADGLAPDGAPQETARARIAAPPLPEAVSPLPEAAPTVPDAVLPPPDAASALPDAVPAVPDAVPPPADAVPPPADAVPPPSDAVPPPNGPVPVADQDRPDVVHPGDDGSGAPAAVASPAGAPEPGPAPDAAGPDGRRRQAAVTVTTRTGARRSVRRSTRVRPVSRDDRG